MYGSVVPLKAIIPNKAYPEFDCSLSLAPTEDRASNMQPDFLVQRSAYEPNSDMLVFSTCGP